VDYIVRNPSDNNYTRFQQDAQLIFTLTLIWHYGRHLLRGPRYPFAISGELLSTTWRSA